MANTYTLISSNVLASVVSTVSFTSIPATYTDLLLRCSVRRNDSGTNITADLRFNSDSATNYSIIRLQGDGAAATSSLSSSNTSAPIRGIGTISTDTANTFGSCDFYIPNYLVSQNKPFSVYPVSENNATTAYITPLAGLWRNTAAITSLSLAGADFAIGSSFYLYGIKNS